jgi:hypothetical protein
MRKERENNVRVRKGVTEDEFVAMTPNSRHLGCCCPPSKSISGPANFRLPKQTSCTTSLFQ